MWCIHISLSQNLFFPNHRVQQCRTRKKKRPCTHHERLVIQPTGKVHNRDVSQVKAAAGRAQALRAPAQSPSSEPRPRTRPRVPAQSPAQNPAQNPAQSPAQSPGPEPRLSHRRHFERDTLVPCV